MLQAASITPFTTLLATLNKPPRRPPPLGLGIGSHLSFGRLTFTISTPSTSICGNILISVISGMLTSVAVINLSIEKAVGKTHPSSKGPTQNAATRVP